MVTLTVPPPLSDLIAADELPSVSIVRFVAFIVPPPVVMRPPEQLFFVYMYESEILTTVPSPYENTPFACVPSVSTVISLNVNVAPLVAKTAEFSP